MIKSLAKRYVISLFGALSGYAISVASGPVVLKSPNMTSILMLFFFIVHVGACIGIFVTEIERERKKIIFLKFIIVLVCGILISFFSLSALVYFFGDIALFIHFFFVPIIFLAFNGLFDAVKKL
jgi:hypothetical protein